MTTETPYLLDQLELADMLEIDGLHAASFALNDDLLDQADAAAEADESFESEEIVLTAPSSAGRARAQALAVQLQQRNGGRAQHDDKQLADRGPSSRLF